MNIVSLITGHQHSNPQIIVLQQIKALIRAYCLYCRFFVHYTWMVKRIPLFSELDVLGYEIVIQERKPGARRADQIVIDQKEGV